MTPERIAAELALQAVDRAVDAAAAKLQAQELHVTRCVEMARAAQATCRATYEHLDSLLELQRQGQCRVAALRQSEENDGWR